MFCHQNHPGNSILFTSAKICEDFNFSVRFQNGVMNTTKIFVTIFIHLFNLFILLSFAKQLSTIDSRVVPDSVLAEYPA